MNKVEKFVIDLHSLTGLHDGDWGFACQLQPDIRTTGLETAVLTDTYFFKVPVLEFPFRTRGTIRFLLRKDKKEYAYASFDLKELATVVTSVYQKTLFMSLISAPAVAQKTQIKLSFSISTYPRNDNFNSTGFASEWGISDLVSDSMLGAPGETAPLFGTINSRVNGASIWTSFVDDCGDNKLPSQYHEIVKYVETNITRTNAAAAAKRAAAAEARGGARGAQPSAATPFGRAEPFLDHQPEFGHEQSPGARPVRPLILKPSAHFVFCEPRPKNSVQVVSTPQNKFTDVYSRARVAELPNKRFDYSTRSLSTGAETQEEALDSVNFRRNFYNCDSRAPRTIVVERASPECDYGFQFRAAAPADTLAATLHNPSGIPLSVEMYPKAVGRAPEPVCGSPSVKFKCATGPGALLNSPGVSTLMPRNNNYLLCRKRISESHVKAETLVSPERGAPAKSAAPADEPPETNSKTYVKGSSLRNKLKKKSNFIDSFKSFFSRSKSCA